MIETEIAEIDDLEKRVRNLLSNSITIKLLAG